MPMRAIQRIGDLRPQAQDLRGVQGPPLEPLRECLPLEQPHDEVVHPLVVSDVVEHADRGVIELRHRAGFPLEAGADLGRGGRCGGSTLIATSRPRRVSRPR
jgi:hypothetical protein